MIKALCDLYGNYRNFKGRSSRSNFFFASLVSLILLILIWMGAIGAGCAIGRLLDVRDYSDIISDVIFWVAAAFILEPLAAITARRINDYGHDPRLLLLGVVVIAVFFVVQSFMGLPNVHIFASVASLFAYLVAMLCLSAIPSKDVITEHGVPAGNVETGFADTLTEREVTQLYGSDSKMKYCRYCGRVSSSRIEMCPYCLAINNVGGQTATSIPRSFKHAGLLLAVLFVFNGIAAGFGFSAYAYMCQSRLNDIETFCTQGAQGYYEDVNSSQVAMFFDFVGQQQSIDETEYPQGQPVAPSTSEPEYEEPVASETSQEVARPASTPAREHNVEDALVAVDLGLPSGTKWAKCNLGAKRETAYGNYYHAEQVDAAIRKALGSGWAAPTSEQTTELVDYCSRRWCTSYNGKAVTGFLFTGPNGNSIFLPAAGNKKNGKKRRVGTDGDYWTSSSLRSGRYQNIDFTSGSITPADDSPSSMQFTVRPVAIN